MPNKKSTWIPSTKAKYTEVETDSYFDIIKTERDIDVESVINDSTNLLLSTKIELFPNEEQIRILHKWFETCRKLYNFTTKFLDITVLDRTNKKYFIDYDNFNHFVNFPRLRDIYLNPIRDEYRNKEGVEEEQVPVHILDLTIKRCVDAYNSSKAKYVNDPRKKKFKINKLKRDKRYKILNLEKDLFSKVKNGFCVSILEEMKSDQPINKTNARSCVFKYDRCTSRYYIFLPVDVETEDFESRDLTCGIDPGARTFLTVYSHVDCYQIYNNPDFSKYHSKIDNINSRHGKGELKKRSYEKALARYNDNMKNRTKDMHFKAAKFLCSKYNKIRLGKISTEKICSKQKANIGKSTKKTLYALSHAKFILILEHQCAKYSCELELVDEHGTTMTCSSCGNIKRDVGANKVYKCDNKDCGLITDRDINAAKNIRYKK